MQRRASKSVPITQVDYYEDYEEEEEEGEEEQQARQQREKVRQVLAKLRTDGILPTLQAVHSKLEQPVPLGYCNVGRVIGADPGAAGFSAGDRVLSNGPHAEVVAGKQRKYYRATPEGSLALEEAKAKLRELIKEVLLDDPPTPSIRSGRGSSGHSGR